MSENTGEVKEGDNKDETTTVVNVRVKHIRPQGYKNLREWMNDPRNVYIGRGGCLILEGVRFPPRASVWANPYKIGAGNRPEVLKNYKRYMLKRLLDDQELQESLKKLQGCRLGCWCVPDSWEWRDDYAATKASDFYCHGQVLCQLIDQFQASNKGNETASPA